jgi:hypothetical protein
LATFFAVVCLAASGLRFWLLFRRGQPSGLDFGNWLDIGHLLLGQALIHGTRTIYPPLIPVLSVLVVRMFGLLTGWALITTLCAATPGLAVFRVLRRRHLGWMAVPIGALLLGTSSTGEAAAWGGLPQLLGLAAAFMLADASEELLSRPEPRHGWRAGGWLLVLAATSHLILAQAVPVIILLFLVHLIQRRRGQRIPFIRAVSRQLPRLLLPSLPLVSLYLRMIGTVGSSFVSETKVSITQRPRVLLANLWEIYRDNPALWKTLLVLALAAPLMTWPFRHSALWRLSMAFVGAFVGQSLISSEPRLVYIVPLTVATAMALLVQSVVRVSRTYRWPSYAVGALAFGYLAGVGLSTFPSQVAYYGALVQPGTVAGLNWIRDHTPPKALMLVAPENGLPFGWWVEGYARRSSLVASSSQWLNVPAERTRAVEAVKLLSTPNPLANSSLVRYRHAGIGWLVLPTTWGGVSPAQLHAFRISHRTATVFRTPALTAVQVPK